MGSEALATGKAIKILALSPHTDDAELSAGGLLARALRENRAYVKVVSFSTGHPSRGASAKEFAASMNALGVWDYELHSFQCRHFPAKRQEILDCLVGLREMFDPDLILTPSTLDVHQDHQVVSSESIRMFRDRCILGYQKPRNSVLGSNLRMFANLEDVDLERKIAAISCYHSQAGREYTEADVIRAIAITNGMKVSTKYAEAYEVIRWIF